MNMNVNVHRAASTSGDALRSVQQQHASFLNQSNQFNANSTSIGANDSDSNSNPSASAASRGLAPSSSITTPNPTPTPTPNSNPNPNTTPTPTPAKRRGRKPGTLSRAARESQRKLNHSRIEKARRSKINEALAALRELVPSDYVARRDLGVDGDGERGDGGRLTATAARS